MASPAAEALPNGISTPPATGSNAANPSPPSQSATQANTQTSQVNGSASQPATTATSALPSTSLQDSGASKRPRDARLIHLMLANMGVSAYTERVPLQLLDFAYRYTSGVLSDAQSYEPPAPSGPTNARRRNAAAGEDGDGVSLAALRTAVSARAAGQFQSHLPKEYLMELASERNRVALPRVEREFGVRLPPERYCFTGVGWGIKEKWEEEVEEDEDEGMEIDGGGPVGGVNGGNAGQAKDDEEMGGMEEEEIDQQEFEEAMGGN